jgi:predicted ATPase
VSFDPKQKFSTEFLVIVNDLDRVVGSDLSILAWLLPNIKPLASQLNSSNDVQESHNQMNLGSICFMLQCFIRIVSSEVHPVVLFLNDIQWYDESALTALESLLCDATGSGYIFFVGTY